MRRTVQQIVGAGALIGALLLLSEPAQAQPAHLVADLNTVRTGGTDDFLWRPSFSDLGGTVLFAVNDGRHGLELWRTDGTAAGTSLVRDICPGICSSRIAWQTVVGSALFFAADDGVHGRELWKSDGTAAGTVLVADINPGLGDSNPFNLQELGGKLLFTTGVPGGDGELWVSDGTAAGTVRLVDIEPGPGFSQPAFLGKIGGIVLFSAATSANGRELWRTDGTAAGTSLVADIRPGTGGAFTSNSSPFPRNADAVAAGGRVFFSADDGVHGYELWASDGTAAGTALVQDIEPGAASGSPGFLVPFGSGILFRADDGTLGTELWKSDGTAAGTTQVADIYPGSSGSAPRNLTVVGTRAYFTADDGVHGSELWVTDGTAAGTSLVADIHPGTAFQWINLPPTGAVGSRLIFYADDGVHGAEPWVTDGTAAGTSLLADANPGATSSYFVNAGSDAQLSVTVAGRFYFRAYTTTDDFEVWTSDGTAAGTNKLLEINDQASAFPTFFWGTLFGARTLMPFGGSLLFQADDGVSGPELWKTDGTAAGTVQVADIWPGTSGSSPLEITPLGGAFLLSADDGVHGSELWRTDGTAAGTSLVKDLSPSSPSNGSPHWLTPLGTKIVFAGPSDGPWTSDGTTAGTQSLGAPVALESPPVPLGGTLLFRGFGANGEELWRTDGTLGGTTQVLDIVPGSSSSTPYQLTLAGGVAFFSATTAGTGRELWKTDGTAAGTVVVKDILPGAGDGIGIGYDGDDIELGERWAALGNSVVFPADDGMTGQEPWVSDGTAAGTVPLGDLQPGALGSEPLWITTAAGQTFFTADDGVHGRELWATNGTAAGTHLVLDIEAGAGSSLPLELRAAGRVLVFSAWDAAHGRELWVSDGTAGGTSRLQDIAPGALSSSPMRMTLAGSALYFVANDNTAGFELWQMPRTALGAALVATKTVAGGFYEGGTVTYTIVVTNNGPTLQPDAAGAEMTDVLPAGLALTGATATAGTVGVDTGTRTVTWNGSLAAGASVTVTITATVQPGTLGTTLSNQAALAWDADADADGVNEASGVSDDPGAAGGSNPTQVAVGPEVLDFYSVAPCRAVDTRTTSALASGVPRTFSISGVCGVPASARAVAVNVTVVGATGTGNAVLWRSGTALPGTSSINFPAGVTRTNNAVVAIANGALDARATVGGSGTVHLVIDVSGYFQ